MTMYRDSRFEMVNTPETWWELVPFIGAGLLALLFTAILVLLVEDADPKVVSTSETVSAPTVNAQQRPTFEGRLPRFVGLAEKGHMDDAEEIGLTLSRKGTFNILKWFSLGMQSLAATQPSSPSKPGPNVSTSSSSRQPSRKAKNVPPPLSRLPIVRSATVFPRNLLVYPAPAVSEQELERPTTPTTPTSPPVTPLTPMSPPPTPMLSMAKMIMHRHDQANRKARRARQYAQQQQQQQQQQLQQQHQPLTQIVVQ